MVEQQHDPQVGPGSNEPAETLFELKGCQREEVVAEAVQQQIKDLQEMFRFLIITNYKKHSN